MISGAGGFLGKNLVKKLVAAGQQVACFYRDNKKNGSSSLISYYQYGDSYKKVVRAITDFSPDVVIHTAAVYDPFLVDDLIGCNITLPLKMLEACKNVGNVHFIYMGSYWQFGEAGTNNIPIDLYSASKLAFESMVDYYAIRKSVFSTELVLYGMYGENDARHKLLDQLIYAAQNNLSLDLTKGEQYLNLLHVDDVSNAVIMVSKMLPKDIYHQKYCVSSENEYTIKELVNKIEQYSRNKLNVNWGAMPYRENEIFVPLYLYDSIPGWQETYMLDGYIVNYFK